MRGRFLTVRFCDIRTGRAYFDGVVTVFVSIYLSCTVVKAVSIYNFDELTGCLYMTVAAACHRASQTIFRVHDFLCMTVAAAFITN